MSRRSNPSPKKICKWYEICPLKNFHEQGKLEKKWIDNFCKGDYERCVRYQMEETGEPHLDNMLPNGKLKEY